MLIRKNLSSFILLFSLISIGCTDKQVTVECDQNKFDCTPKTSEIAGSEPVINQAVTSEPVSIKEDVKEKTNLSSNESMADGDPDFYISPEMPWIEQKKIINSSFKSLIKSEINTILGTNTDTWVIDIKSVKDGIGDQKGFVIYKYDVTSSSPDHDFLISAQTCTAHAQISSEDNRTPMAVTLDTNCYKNLEGFF
jgi:hypothetical protein